MIQTNTSTFVSNPNGVNLHENIKAKLREFWAGFKPQRGKFTLFSFLIVLNAQISFKPQRGKFTLICAILKTTMKSFKPQRGKFTPNDFWDDDCPEWVSNPNGVNLHSNPNGVKISTQHVSNPNGVNLHGTHSFRFWETRAVSNPNGVNLHFVALVLDESSRRFKPQRGKFTPCSLKGRCYTLVFQTPTG